MDHLTHVLAQRNSEGKSSNILMAFRCMVLDTATEFCFASTFDALSTPDFRPPLLVAMNRALPAFAALKHLPLLRKAALALPSWYVSLPRLALETSVGPSAPPLSKPGSGLPSC